MIKKHKFLIFHLVYEVRIHHKVLFETFIYKCGLSIINFRVLEYWVLAVFGDLVELVLLLYIGYKFLNGLEILAIFVLILNIFAHLMLHGDSFEQLFWS